MRPLALLLAFAAVLAGAESAQACSCAFVPAGRLLAETDGAVIARHLAVRPIGDSPSAQVEFVLRVGRVYNGGPGLRRGRRIAVRTASSDAVCGLTRSIGELTGLFLQRVDGHWTSGSCLQISARRMRRAGDAGSAGAGAARSRCIAPAHG